MEKKVLEMYEAPACKAVELKVQSALLVGSSGIDGLDEADDITGGNKDKFTDD